MTKKWMCVNLNEKSVLNGPEVALCLLNQCKQWVPLCNMTHLFTLLSSWQRDQRFSIVLVALYPLQLTSSVVSCTADGCSSQCGWSSDEKTSTGQSCSCLVSSAGMRQVKSEAFTQTDVPPQPHHPTIANHA